MQRKIRRQIQRRLQERAAKALWTSVAVTGLFFGTCGYSLANPTGGTVTSGEATISGEGTSAVTVTQTTDKTGINWNSFSISSGESVTFVQPGSNSIAVNRVTGTDASAIYGTLSANGKVYLINPNGVLFGSTAQVNVGGIVASTLDISDSDLESGNYTFSGNSTATVSNAGTIVATDGGYVVLLGRQVGNSGTITANNGTVALGAGSRISLDFYGDGLLSLKVDGATLGALAANSGKISADGGKVFLSADAADTLAGTVVNNSGIVQAQSISDINGTIVLSGGSNGMVTNSGTLDASGTDSGETGGTVKVLGNNIDLATGTKLDVSGDAGGGTAFIGGNYQGGGDEQHAATTIVAAGATINADALTTGDGGTVVVWSDDTTTFAGTISAKGGSQSGDGGLIETSSKGSLKVADTANITTTAANGSMGIWLLDPADITIGSGGDISVSTLAASLAGSNVTIQTGSSGSGNGDITVAGDLGWSGDGVLTLSAYRDININSNITINDTGTDATGHAGLDLKYGTGGSGDYSIADGKSITFGGTAPTLTINNNSYTIIDSVAELESVSLSGYYALGTNIDLSGNTYTGSIIDSFSGIFDGLGHTINNLTINSSGDYVGFIGTLTGAIKNLGLEGGSVTVDNSTSSYVYVGGLVGYNNGGTITDCYTTGDVTGTAITFDGAVGYVGGLVGWNSGTISDCYATGDVVGTCFFAYVGGLAGLNDINCGITNCYATGNANGTGINTSGTSATVGGLVGVNYLGTITDCYATGNVTGGIVSSSPNGATAGGLAGGNGGTITGCYATGDVISTNTQAFESYVGGLVGNSSLRTTISDCYATGDVTFINTESESHVGGLVGYINEQSTITDCYATGNVTVISTNPLTSFEDCVGGLVGLNYNGTITNCYTTGDITGIGHHASIGGLVGGNGGTITDCYATGNVTSATYIIGYVGGLVGRGGTITNCYTIGNVTDFSTNAYVGGLVGADFSTITNCYATGNVTGLSTNAYVGGLAGQNNGTVTNSFWDTSMIIISGHLDSSAAGDGITAYINGTESGIGTIGTSGFYYVAVSADSLSSEKLILLCAANSSSTVSSSVYDLGTAVSGTKTFTDLDLTLATLTVGSLDTTAITNSMLAEAYNSAAIYSVDRDNNLTVTSGYDFQTTGGITYEPGGNVTTAGGTQTYNGPVVLTSDTSLTADTVTFKSTVDGAYDLAIDGDAVFYGNVGATTALTGLSVSGNALYYGTVTIREDSSTDAPYTSATAYAQSQTGRRIAFWENNDVNNNDILTIASSGVNLEGIKVLTVLPDNDDQQKKKVTD